MLGSPSDDRAHAAVSRVPDAFPHGLRFPHEVLTWPGLTRGERLAILTDWSRTAVASDDLSALGRHPQTPFPVTRSSIQRVLDTLVRP